MLTTKRQPATVGEILVEEFMQPMGLTQAALAEAMGVQRKHVNELCNDRRTVTAATALIPATPRTPSSGSIIRAKPFVRRKRPRRTPPRCLRWWNARDGMTGSSRASSAPRRR